MNMQNSRPNDVQARELEDEMSRYVLDDLKLLKSFRNQTYSTSYKVHSSL